jgi:hypothetical protein
MCLHLVRWGLPYSTTFFESRIGRIVGKLRLHHRGALSGKRNQPQKVSAADSGIDRKSRIEIGEKELNRVCAVA